MWLRRAVFTALWGAVLVLPLWVLLGRAFFGAPIGLQFLVQIVLVPLLFVGQVVVTVVHFLRPAVRRARAVSWPDTAAFGLSWLAQLGLGFFLVDTAGSNRASAFTALVGTSALPLSSALSAVSIVVTIGMGVVLLVLGLREAAKDARAALAPTFPTVSGPDFDASPFSGRTIRIEPHR